MKFSAKDNLKPHTHETRSEDEANHSMQSYANIQASTLIQSEKHSFQYQKHCKSKHCKSFKLIDTI